MANEIGLPDYAPGLSTVYATIDSGANQINASTGALLARSATNWPSCQIPLADSACEGFYLGSVPANTPAGRYAVNFWLRLGASAANTDTKIAGGTLVWNGTAEVSLLSLGSPMQAGAALSLAPVQSFNNTGQTTSLPTDATITSGAIQQVVAALAGTTMVVLNPVGNGSIALFVGRAYKAAYGNSLDFYRQPNSGWPPDLTGWTCSLVIAKTALNVNPGDATDTWAMTIPVASGSGQMIRCELSSTQTAGLAPGQGGAGYAFKILGTPPASSDSVALMSGNVSVSP